MPVPEISAKTTKDMLGRNALISVARAGTILSENLSGILLPVEHVALESALDRVTAEAINSPEDLPARPRSTMDGYAVCAADTFGASESMPCYLNIVGEVRMGEVSDIRISRGNCMRISTGGTLPEGADAVVMFEHTVPVDASMIEIVKGVGQGGNVIQRGDDIGKGRMALPAGHKLRPQDLGLLAGLGISKVAVRKKVSMGILSTGDEIVPYTTTPPPGKVRDINGITLAAAATRLGAEVTNYGIIADREETFFPAIEKAVAENDLVVFSGGSSVGTRDLGEQAIERLGNPGILVHGVTLKPGKPIIIGLHNQKPLFGLPGHPVSAMVCFELFVARAIAQLSGLSEFPRKQYVQATLSRNVPSAAGRRDIVRVRLTDTKGKLTAEPVLGKSGSISTLSRAHGYITIAESLQGLPESTEVEVYLYQ